MEPLEGFWDFRRVLETPRKNCYANTFGFPYSSGRFLIFHLQIDEGTGAENNLVRYRGGGVGINPESGKGGTPTQFVDMDGEWSGK